MTNKNAYLQGSTDGSGHGGTAIVTRQEDAVKHPKMYKVLLHNDNYTPMDFVITVLQKFFRKSQNDAYKIMMDVHKTGVGICGIYPFEIAETKVAQVSDFAKGYEYPLKCTAEEESTSN